VLLVRALGLLVRRPFAGNGVAPPRPPPILAVGGNFFIPVEFSLALCVPHPLVVVLDRPLTAGDLAAGGNAPEAEPPAMSGPGKDPFAIRKFSLRAQM
jgi:hypothetical protein